MADSFFEGAEKLLEIWFKETDIPTQDLRDIERPFLDEMLSKADCKIISSLRSKFVDSYILSESSLFVMKNRVILKTCGTTNQIRTISYLLEIAERFCGFTVIEKVFYSRKKLMKPFLQHGVHQTFEREVEELKKFIGGGKSYVFGDMDEECWFLFMFSRAKHLRLPLETTEDQDSTLEVLMVGLDPSQSDDCLETELLFPDSKVNVDGHYFDPCGYSANGVIDERYYYSVHVTPQEEFSYASFETNVIDNIDEIVKHVVYSFNPQGFIVTFFSQQSQAYHKALWTQRELQVVRRPYQEDCGTSQYRRIDIQCAVLEEYQFSFAYYKQFG